MFYQKLLWMFNKLGPKLFYYLKLWNKLFYCSEFVIQVAKHCDRFKFLVIVNFGSSTVFMFMKILKKFLKFIYI